jgi:hypothetical protein
MFLNRVITVLDSRASHLITHDEAYKIWIDLPLDKTGGDRDLLNRIWNALIKGERRSCGYQAVGFQ